MLIDYWLELLFVIQVSLPFSLVGYIIGWKLQLYINENI